MYRRQWRAMGRLGPPPSLLLSPSERGARGCHMYGPHRKFKGITPMCLLFGRPGGLWKECFFWGGAGVLGPSCRNSKRGGCGISKIAAAAGALNSYCCEHLLLSLRKGAVSHLGYAGPAPTVKAHTAQQLRTKTVQELAEICKGLGVPVSGRKDALINRILQAQEKKGAT